MAFDYDVIIIGSGPAGFSCAMQSSKFDKKVLIVEANDQYLGGTWINTGTVPSKALREAAKTIYKFHEQFGDDKGRKPFERFKMDDLLHYQSNILESKNKKVKNDIIKNLIDTARGFGALIDKNTVEVTDHIGKKTTYTAENILISTGSSPTPPKKFTLDHKIILDSQSILKLTHIPRRLTIVGAGIIAFEYASIFAVLGTRVTILNEGDEWLPFLDTEIRDTFLDILKSRNIGMYKNAKIKKVAANPLRNSTEVTFKTKDDGRVQVVETEHVLYAGGLKPYTSGLNLESLNIKTDKDGFIKTDRSYATSTSNIYAAGDVIGQPSSASASFLQGRLAACNMFSIPVQEVVASIPYGIYSLPDVAGIGLTEDEAKKLGMDVSVGRAYYNNITQADISNEQHGLLKLVFSTSDMKLLGVHIVGQNATDLVHLGQSVIAFNGDIRYFIQNVLNYPSYSETYRIAAFNGINRVYKAGVKYKKLLEKK